MIEVAQAVGLHIGRAAGLLFYRILLKHAP